MIFILSRGQLEKCFLRSQGVWAQPMMTHASRHPPFPGPGSAAHSLLSFCICLVRLVGLLS